MHGGIPCVTRAPSLRYALGGTPTSSAKRVLSERLHVQRLRELPVHPIPDATKQREITEVLLVTTDRCYEPGGLYSTVFSLASSTSSGDMRTVVLRLTAPDAPTVMATAAISALLGVSTIR